ncbi:MAG: lipid A export permease/ATP-binding protein MsbA [Burkholderiales bacterium]|nr:lipid A export permease/ATP-binding protein MsbA [Burkholderiales bacterium]
MKLPPHLVRLIAMLGPYRRRVALALLGMAITAATEPMFPAVMKVLLDQGFSGKPPFPLWTMPLAIIGIFVARGMSTLLTSYMMSWVTTHLLNRLRQMVFDRMLNVPAEFYASNSTGRVINTIMFETQQIVDMLRSVLASLIRDSMIVLGLVSYLLWLNWRLTLVTLVMLPLLAIVVRVTGKRVRKLTAGYLEVSAELTQVIEETTRAQQVIKVFGGQEYEQARFERRAAKLRGYVMRTMSAVSATAPITQILVACALAVVISIALVQSTQGETTVGGFVSFFTAMLLLLTPLKHLAEVNGPLQRGLAAADAVFSLIDMQPERTDGKTLSARATGKIEYIDVGFSYPKQEKPALAKVNLTIQPGETVAFVGTSGGGKTTLVNLVPEFYAPSQGEIRLDGEPIRNIALVSLRAQIAMVSQNVVLFDDTIAANIAYGDANPDRVRVEAAVKAAHLSDMIAALPDGLDSMIGDNGSRLSGGQRQRLAIARAIYKDAPILILDEATSALDTESERAVQEALDQLMQSRTTLVIAHRLSTIERASRIVVLVAGEIVEVGTHAELLAMNRVYANLYHLQFEGKNG